MAGPPAKLIIRSAALTVGILFVAAGSIAAYRMRQNQEGKRLMDEAHAAFLRQDYESALRKDDAALSHRMTNRNLGIAHAGRSEVYLARRQFDPAIRDLDEAIRRIPDVPEVIATRAYAYLLKGDPERAVVDYSRAIKLAPNLFPALLSRAKIFLNLAKPNEALADLNEAIRVAPNDAEALLERGRAYEMKGDLAAAVASFESAERVDPENKIGQRANLERYLVRDLGGRGLAANRAAQYEQAITLYTAALAHHPPALIASSLLCDRGASYGKVGALEKAEADYDEAIRLDPKPVTALYNRGWAFASRGEFAKANADFDRAIPNLAQLAPAQRCSISEQLARMRATSSNPALRNGPQAVALAREACELTQWQNSKCLDTLAAASAEAGDFASAVKMQSQALEAHDFPETIGQEMQQRLALYQRQQPFHYEPE